MTLSPHRRLLPHPESRCEKRLFPDRIRKKFLTFDYNHCSPTPLSRPEPCIDDHTMRPLGALALLSAAAALPQQIVLDPSESATRPYQQPDSSDPVDWPYRPLPWGEVNFIATTDMYVSSCCLLPACSVRLCSLPLLLACELTPTTGMQTRLVVGPSETRAEL